MHELALHYLPAQDQTLPKVEVEYCSPDDERFKAPTADLNFTFTPQDRG
jgi:hypothetical protein